MFDEANQTMKLKVDGGRGIQALHKTSNTYVSPPFLTRQSISISRNKNINSVHKDDMHAARKEKRSLVCHETLRQTRTLQNTPSLCRPTLVVLLGGSLR